MVRGRACRTRDANTDSNAFLACRQRTGITRRPPLRGGAPSPRTPRVPLEDSLHSWLLTHAPPGPAPCLIHSAHVLPPLRLLPPRPPRRRLMPRVRHLL